MTLLFTLEGVQQLVLGIEHTLWVWLPFPQFHVPWKTVEASGIHWPCQKSRLDWCHWHRRPDADRQPAWTCRKSSHCRRCLDNHGQTSSGCAGPSQRPNIEFFPGRYCRQLLWHNQWQQPHCRPIGLSTFRRPWMLVSTNSQLEGYEQRKMFTIYILKGMFS